MEFTKDPSTHPVHGPLTEERLIRVRDELAAAAKRSDGGNLGYMMADAVKAIDELLALWKAGQEPVYQVWDWHWYDAEKHIYDEAKARGEECRIVYAAPQLPQTAVMDDEQSKRLFDEWSGGDAALGELRENGVPDEFISMLKDFSLATWEACREAMVKQPAQFIVTSDERMMEMPATNDIDAVAAMLQGDHRDLSYPVDPQVAEYEKIMERAMPDECWCQTCRPVTMSDMRFVVCPDCGNKRCPHANDHRNACTGSNEPGQEGSAYPAAPQQEVK